MPLVNRAPVNAAGQIMVTGTTPTPAWPSLGGMTYDPVTGELAVTSAVPNATDPWVGGLRFTNLGALYIVTTIPSPVFYVGGLPVSTLGQLFMSANPPVGSVGGWPIAGDGGVAGIGSGIGPVPIFWAPLLTTLVPTLAGNPTFTFTRATTAYVADNENILRQAISNEARFQGARRVRNYLAANTQDFSVAGWTKQNVTYAFGATGPTGLADATTITSIAGGAAILYSLPSVPTGVLVVNSWWIRRRTGTGTVQIRSADLAEISVVPSGSWQRFSTPPAISTASSYCVLTLGTIGDQVDVTYAQSEVVSGQSNQAPSEYVSVGVLAAPYHGNAIDGVKYFPTTNGNSVAGNVVTEATGTAIPLATTLGYVAENAATNLCLQSQTFDNAAWTVQGATLVANNAVAPDGTLTGDTLTTTVNSGNNVSQFFGAVTASVPYTFSCWVKGTAGQQIYAHIETTPDVQQLVTFTGVWQRVTISVTPTITNIRPAFEIYGRSAGGHLPNVTFALWGAQVEQASDPSSYIPTTTVAVTRNVDVLQYPMLTNLDGALATIYAETYLPFMADGATQYLVTATVTSLPTLQYSVSAPKKLGLYSGGFITTVNALNIGAVNKNAAAYSGVTCSVCLNGGVVAVGAYGAGTNVGNLGVGGGGGPLRGSIRNVKFYNVRIADADLITMTA